MTKETYILKSVSKVKKTFSSLTLLAFLSTQFAPSISFAKSSNAQILGNPAMAGMLMAVANLNHSMRVAAENPQDEWRIQNVRHAMGMIPVALMAVAGEFKQNKLVNNDLPTVLGMLGGFVDKNAADGYQKFLQNPSASAIPKLGAGFPQEYIAKAEAEAKQGNSGNENAAGKSEDQGKGMSTNAVTPASDLKQFKNDDLLDLGSFVASQKMNAEKPASQTAITGNESAPKEVAATDAVAPLSPETASRGIASTADGKQGFAPGLLPRDLDSDIAAVAEGKDGEKSSEKKDDGFFKKVGEKKEQKAKSAKKRKKLREGISFLPSVGRFFPAFAIISEFIITRAHAQGGDDDSSGASGGEILQGIAAIIAATAPIVAVAIQADADRDIANIQAQNQKELTKIAAENAKYLSDQQKELTVFQTKVAQDVAEKNNQFATDRLERQLAELRTQRDQNYQMEKEKRALEADYNNKRIELANKQADQQVALNKESLQAEIAKAGLSQGFGSKNNIPGNQKLTLTSAATGGSQTYSAGTKGSAVNNNATSQQGSFSGPSLSNALAGNTSAGGASQNTSSTGFTKSNGTARGMASTSAAKASLVSNAGIPSLKGGTAMGGTAQSVTTMNSAVQTVNARGMAQYKTILGRRGISGTSKSDIANSKNGNSNGKQIIAANSALAFQAPQRGFLGTGRPLVQPGNAKGITRPIRHINPYDGSVEADDNGGDLVGHGTPISFSFSQ